MTKAWRIFTGIGGWIFTIICSGIIIGSVVAFLMFNHYTKDLPDYSALEEYNPPTMSRIYARDGRLITEFAKEKRIYTPLSAVPDQVVHAFLSAEDKNFYSHTGIDYNGIGRALLTNIVHYGDNRNLVGGSTITQQVVKNFLLTNEQSLRRKIREAVLALRITNVYSKDRILELYLNEIFLGNRSYGIAAAALNYFNRSLHELTLEEAALLAALPKAPSHLNPYHNYDRALERRNWVLERMYEDSRISKEEMEEAKAKPITLRARDKQETVDAPYFAAQVQQFIQQELGDKALNEGGLSVVTTLDPRLQTEADAALRQQLVAYDRKRGYRGAVGKIYAGQDKRQELQKHQARRLLLDGQKLAVVTALNANNAEIMLDDATTGTLPMALLSWTRRVFTTGVLGDEVRQPADILSIGDVVIVGAINAEQRSKLSAGEAKTAWDLQQVPLVNGAMVVTEPNSGKVLALSGGYSYQASSFNRATQAKRQPGSAYKPFVYLSAFESGLSPATQVLDAPIELSQGSGGGVWRPENYADDYLGPTTLRRGLEKSRNTMTVRLGQMLGMPRIIEVGKRFGIYDAADPNLSMVLGTVETTVLRLLNAYAMLANGGFKIQPVLVERIEDRHGNVVYQRDKRDCLTCQVDEVSWAPETLTPPALLDMRERIVDARVAYQMVSLLQGVVQRGTAVSAASLPWALGGKTGTTNESRDAWFMGISPEVVAGVYIGFDTPQSLGAKETGSSLALPVFREFIQTALKDKPKTEFTVPSGLHRAKIDGQTGMAIEPWEDDGRSTFWEVFLRPQIPLFKPDSLLAVGEIENSQAQYLGMGNLPLDEYGRPQPLLPWQTNNPDASGELQPGTPNPLPFGYERPQPPSTYIPPGGYENLPRPANPRAEYVPQIPPAQAAPQRRHPPRAVEPAASTESPLY